MSKPATSNAASEPLPPPKNVEAVACCSNDQGQGATLHLQSSMWKRHQSCTWNSLSAMPKEFTMHAIDPPVPTGIEAEDTRLHKDNESLDPFQRAVTSLNDQLSEEVYDEAERKVELILKDIMAVLEKDLEEDAEELHLIAADGLGAAYKFLMAKYPARAIVILQLMMRYNIDSKNRKISKIWRNAILDLVNNASGPKGLEKDAKGNETLDPFERALTCLKSDELSEKVYVAERTAELIQKDTEKYFKDIFPELEKELEEEVEELHSAAADGFGAVYKFLMAKYPARAMTILQLMFRCMDSKNPKIYQIWRKTILDLMIALVPTEQEKDGQDKTAAVPSTSATEGRSLFHRFMRQLWTGFEVVMGWHPPYR